MTGNEKEFYASIKKIAKALEVMADEAKKQTKIMENIEAEVSSIANK
jgi:hypothetical protein